MSMPSINLDCEKCDFHGSTSTVWGDFKYIENKNEFHLTRTLGWCFDCQRFVPIEDFSNIDEVIAEIGTLTAELKSDYEKWLSFLFSIFTRKHTIGRVDEISDLAKRLSLIRQRKGSEKCLACGSSNIKPFDGDYSLEFEVMEGLVQGSKRTGFTHPDCGGEIIASSSGMRLNMRFSPRYYNFDGSAFS